MSDVQNEVVKTADEEFDEMYSHIEELEVDNNVGQVSEEIHVEAPAELADLLEEEEEEVEEEMDEEVEATPAPARRRTRRTKTKTIEDSDDVEGMYVRKVLRSTNRDVERREFAGERIISKEGDTDVRGEADEKREEWEIISNAIKNRKIILRGMIVGIDTVGEGSKQIVLANVQLENSKGYYNIKIPASHLFPIVGKYKDPEEGVARIKRDMTFRIGSNIDFVVYDAKVNRKEVYASRVHAMNMLGYEYYTRKDDKTGKPRIQEGQIVKANITLVGKFGLYAECCGAEFFIKTNEMDYKHETDLRDTYCAGDSINVRVSNIRTVEYEVGGQKLQIVMLDASRKQALPNPAEKYWNDFKEGANYKGVVKFRNERGQYYVTLCDKLDCLCLPPNTGIPKMGQNCIVTVTKKETNDNDTKLMFGKFIALLR